MNLRLTHRGAMPEGSRGLSDQRYPRKAFPNTSILKGCQTFCDLSEVVNARAFSGGVGIPLAQDASTPGYLLAALRAGGTASSACKKIRCTLFLICAFGHLHRNRIASTNRMKFCERKA
jgi:hypothetical protein